MQKDLRAYFERDVYAADDDDDAAADVSANADVDEDDDVKRASEREWKRQMCRVCRRELSSSPSPTSKQCKRKKCNQCIFVTLTKFRLLRKQQQQQQQAEEVEVQLPSDLLLLLLLLLLPGYKHKFSCSCRICSVV